MAEIRDILTLLSEHYGTKYIAKVLHCSRNTVKYYRDLVISNNLNYKSLLAEPIETLEKYFLRNTQQSHKHQALLSTFPRVSQELSRVGVTLLQLWNEYKLIHPDGYSYTSYCNYYREFSEHHDYSMHLTHLPGDKLYLDFAGKKLSYVDRETGEIIECEVFISVLPSSQLTFAHCVHSQCTEDFIDCINKALHYYGGVPKVLVPDNLKSAVTKADKYESELNTQFGQLSAHYGCSVLPARVRKPKDKALVEAHVNILYTRVYAKIRNITFFSLKELNEAVYSLVEDHNYTSFQGKDYSRREAFDRAEKDTLSPLPSFPFEIVRQRIATVMKNSHIQLTEDHHYYSLPYRYIGEKVTLSYNSRDVHIYLKGERIAFYKRNRHKYGYTTTPDHLPSSHKFVSQWNAKMFIDKGTQIDAAVGKYLQEVLAQKNYPEQLYRSCMGILSLAKKKGKDRLIAACKSGLYAQVYSYTYIKNVLSNHTEQLYLDTQLSPLKPLPSHTQIRGAEYYKNQLLNNKIK